MEADDTSTSTPSPHCKSVAFHLPGFFTLFSDGSVSRHSSFPSIAACHQFSQGVATKDVIIDASIGISARIFLPHSTHKRLPVVLYAHGGAYCIGDPAMSLFHGFCHRVAVKSQAIWVSVKYRLAPEHRLPAAYQDGYCAFKWLQSVGNGTGSEPWLDEFGDFSRCFLAGDSAGAALMFNVAMRLAEEDGTASNIWGLMLVHPGFHTEAKRISMAKEDVLPGLDLMYQLALPEGANFDYPSVNPLNPEAPSLSRLSAYPHVLVAVAEKDLRYDQTMKFYEIVKAFCEDVQLVISSDKDHAFHIFDGECEEAVQLEQELAKFVCSSG